MEIDDGKGKTPLDKADTAEIERLHKMADRYCRDAKTNEMMEEIARRLVASCFFFTDERWEEDARGVWVYHGTLGSRLPFDRWGKLKSFLNKGLKFMVRMGGSRDVWKEINVKSSADSVTDGWFSMGVDFEVAKEELRNRILTITMVLESKKGGKNEWEISGFPRVFAGRAVYD